MFVRGLESTNETALGGQFQAYSSIPRKLIHPTDVDLPQQGAAISARLQSSQKPVVSGKDAMAFDSQ